MNDSYFAAQRVVQLLGYAFFAFATFFAIVAVIDWAVRTRRISPFNPVARFFRKTIDPMMAPVERRIVRAGGLPHNAPWWTLAIIVVVGIVILSLLPTIIGAFAGASTLVAAGPAGVLYLLISWTIGILQIALIVRVISSWFRLSPYSPWVRWSYVLTEPILRPLRQFIPPFGMIDVTPIVAYFLLKLVGWLVLGFFR